MNETQQRIASGLREAMRAETEGHHFYLMAAQSTSDPKGREAFADLAREEQQHFEFLRDQLRSLLATGAVDTQLALGSAKEFVGAHPIFTAEIRQRVGTAHYEMTALSIGVQLELSSVRFYRGEAAAVDDPGAKSFYSQLAEWEQGHLATLQRQVEALKEDYWHAAHFAPF